MSLVGGSRFRYWFAPSWRKNLNWPNKIWYPRSTRADSLRSCWH